MQVVVMTSDAHAGNVFAAFTKAFEHHWSDCPWPVVAVGETVTVSEFPTMLMGMTPPDVSERERVRAYLAAHYRDETVMVLLDDFIFYAHPVNTSVLERAHRVLLADKSVGAVLFGNNLSREPELFYDGFLGEFDGPRGLAAWDAGIWRTDALVDQMKRVAWPRMLGTYHAPMVYSNLVIGDRLLCGAVIVGLMAHRSVAMPYVDALVVEEGFKIYELEELRTERRPNLREAMITLIERYNFKL